MKAKTNRKLIVEMAMCLGVVSVFALPVTCEARPEFSGNSKVRWITEASDVELAMMRGRYVDGSQIVNFGVQMFTFWQTSAGDVIREGMEMSIDLNSARRFDFRPVMTISRLNETTGSVSHGDNLQRASVNGEGVENITGVAQSILVAGEENTVNNDVKIDITQGAGAGSGEGGQSMTSGTMAFQGESGAVSSYTMDSNGIGFEIILPDDQGRVIQQIRSGKGLLQSAQLASSRNLIQNNIKLTLGTSEMGGGTGNNFVNTLQGIRGLPQVGMF